MNNINLIGRLTKDPELRFAQGSGTAVARFSLAVTRKFKKDETDFINCVAFGKTAETISQYVTKGRQLGVSGSLRTGSYDAQDGTKRYTADVAVESFTFVGGGNNEGNNNQSSYSTPGNNNDTFGNGNYDDITPVDDGDMPF
ncbi:single-stranded DNA-binding protein [Clostridium sp. LP20]|uniref:single-stranded DNA-binding protein n=1 Tax=Clostridium sp. LP20 TaxID=3418665 RepID=UPI003EE79F75